MSYNINTWRTKEMVDFKILLEAIHGMPDTQVILERDSKISVRGWMEFFEMSGELLGEYVLISKVEFWGEGSGSVWEDFKLMMAQSSGRLVASQVWEGGDSISRLTVIDGVVLEEEIEI